ncbi:MAG: GNAT family N-acetyltransferase [Gammaproteobacteria bacterium]|nr:GNAT family N-acetyltransferase [Gammaproteobacteria bacterium]
MDLIAGIQTDLPRGLYSALSAYRHEIFVGMLGWELNTHYGYEQDQFDRSDTIYVVAKGDGGRITGCARLLPTTQPYLLGEVFPELLNGLKPPSSPDVWELSRFAAVDLANASRSAHGQMSSPEAVELLQGAIRTAASLGAKQLITVSPIGIERLLRYAGFRAHRAGPPKMVGRHALFACWIEVDAASLA